MSDKFDQRLREKLGGYKTPFEPTDWAALNERLDVRGSGANRRIALILFGAIILGSAILGGLYQVDMRRSTPSLGTPAGVLSQAGDQAAPLQDAASEHAIDAASNAQGLASQIPANTPREEQQSASLKGTNKTVTDAQAVQSSKSDRGRAGIGIAGSNSAPQSNDLANSSANNSVNDLANSSANNSANDLANSSANNSVNDLANSSANKPAKSPIPGNTAAQQTAGSKSQIQTLANAQRERLALPAEQQRATAAAKPANATSGALAADRNASETRRAASADEPTNSLLSKPLEPRQAQPWDALLADPAYPVTPIAATHDPFALPGDRSWELNKRDITLRKTPVRWALAAGPGLNTALTAFGDGFRPAWDIGVAGEAWFGSGAFVSAGLRYGVYRFQQSDVACGDHAAHGLSDAVHCPDAMLGDESLWEIPLQAGYGVDLKKVNGRFRVFGGLTARISRQADYHVEFHGVSAGDTLFFDPVVISVAPASTAGSPENYTYDANALQDMTSVGTTTATPGKENGSATSRTSLAVELGFGYEQFLAPTVSLGIQPRLDIPLNRLPMGDGRAYHLGMNAMLRWYPNWNR